MHGIWRPSIQRWTRSATRLIVIALSFLPAFGATACRASLTTYFTGWWGQTSRFWSSPRIVGDQATGSAGFCQVPRTHLRSSPKQIQRQERGDWAMWPGFGVKGARHNGSALQKIRDHPPQRIRHRFLRFRACFHPKTAAHCPAAARSPETDQKLKKPAEAGFKPSLPGSCVPREKVDYPMCNPPFTEKSAPVV